MDKFELGVRIRKLRENLGFSQSQLAKQIGWGSHTTVVDVESGRKDVKAWEVVKLATALHTDLATLLSQDQLPERPYVLWRKKPAESAAAIEGQFLQRGIDYAFLESLFTPQTSPKDCLPLHDWDPAEVDYAWANKLADQVRGHLQLGAYPASDLVKVLENRFGVRFLVLDLGSDGSAASYKEGEQVAILINGDEVSWRQIFSVAHELFHLVTWNVEAFRRIEENQSLQEKNESLADSFAAALLMPSDRVREEFDQFVIDGKISSASLISVARQFGVSTSALLWRLKYLRVFTTRSVKELLDNSEFRSLDRDERRGDGLHHPILGFRYVRLAYQAFETNQISKARLARLLGVGLRDVDHFLIEQGLPPVASHEVQVSYT